MPRLHRAARAAIGCALLLLLVGMPVACWRGESPADWAGELDEMRPAGSEKINASTTEPVDLSSFKREYKTALRAPRPVFEKYLPVLGAAPMLDFLEKKYPACHGQAHELGRVLFAQSGDLSVALQQCDTRCTSGCMHGVLAEAFGSSTPAAITAKANSFCLEGEMARLHKPGNCAHGMGHALMFVTGGDRKRSVEACLGFAREAMQYYCATGVYMEEITGDRHSARPSASAHSPCDEEALFPAACYRYKGLALVKEFGDYRRVEHECLRLDRPHQLGCFHGLGHASIRAVFEIPQRMASTCSAGDRDDRVACIEGVIEKLASYNEQRAKIACTTLGGEMRAVCDQAVQRQMYGLDTPTLGLYYDRTAVATRRHALAEHIGGMEHMEHDAHHHE